MTRTLLTPGAIDMIIARLDRLSAEQKPAWGKMSVSQMLAHLELSLAATCKEIMLPTDRFGRLFYPISAYILLSKRPFPRGLYAPKATLQHSPGTFDVEKQRLINRLKNYEQNAPACLSPRHNILGRIRPEQSAHISYKHIDHHLRQFGV